MRGRRRSPPRRDPLLQLLEPVEDDVDAGAWQHRRIGLVGCSHVPSELDSAYFSQRGQCCLSVSELKLRRPFDAKFGGRRFDYLE